MSAKGKKPTKQNNTNNAVSTPADTVAHHPIEVKHEVTKPVQQSAPVKQAVPQEAAKPVAPKPVPAQENQIPQTNGHTVPVEKKSSGQRNVDIIWPWEGYNVLVAGSFNGWQGVPTESVGGVKKLSVALPPGKHEYKFIVDGEWKYDGTKPLSRDHRGNINNSIEFN